MRAAVYEVEGQPLKIYDDVEIIEPRAGEVRVRVHYCGICHSDLSCINGAMPFLGATILGHEASGIVDCVGAGVTHLEPGDHVVLTPAPPCGDCYYCQRDQQQLCVNGQCLMTGTLMDGISGLSRNGEPLLRGVGMGAWAEYAITQAHGAIKIDPEIPLDTACVIGCALQTGVGAVLNTAAVEQGATVAILGAGGIGIAAIQGAVVAGATTILVSDPVSSRRDAALEFGATHVLDPSEEDLATRCFELTSGIGMDYVFETAGVAALVEQGLAVSRNGGTTVCVGAPPLEDSVTIPNAVLFTTSEKRLCGCMLGSSNSLREIPRLIRLWQSGRLDLEGMVTSRRPLDEINEGLADLAATRGIRTVLTL